MRLRPEALHRLDESATGYSLASCTPALLASASPGDIHGERASRNFQPPLARGWGIFSWRNGEISFGVDMSQGATKLPCSRRLAHNINRSRLQQQGSVFSIAPKGLIYKRPIRSQGCYSCLHKLAVVIVVLVQSVALVSVVRHRLIHSSQHVPLRWTGEEPDERHL